MMNNVGPLGDDLPITASSGTLFRIDADHSVTAMAHDIGVSNGPCWSPDNRTFYFTDSMAQVIWAYDFDLDAGTISNRRVLSDTKDYGYPDGATVDAGGFIWSARWEAPACCASIRKAASTASCRCRRSASPTSVSAERGSIHSTSPPPACMSRTFAAFAGRLVLLRSGHDGFEKHAFAG
jgi:hypothetical protein